MEFKAWNGYCFCSLGGRLPEDGVRVDAAFPPLVLTVERDMLRSRGCFAALSLAQALAPEDCSVLLPQDDCTDGILEDFIAEHGASVLNTAFPRAFERFSAPAKKSNLRVTLVGLGDVGGSVLTALKLLGRELSEIAVYDPNEALCRRYEKEMNQVLSPDEHPLPRVTICEKDRLFDCDLFLFTASRGVPAVGSNVSDVRMAQFEKNREMLREYAKMARNVEFCGLFCQISDPVDQLSRVVFLESNRDETGKFDGRGLLPEQVRGFGLGVMAARAAYYAEKEGIAFETGRVYGPHGADLIVANDPVRYDAALSARLTELTVTANLRVRELGFKPYIAPALSSAAVSLLRLLRGQTHFSAVPMGGAYFGCRSRMTEHGILVEREPLAPALYERITAVHRTLEGFPYD